MSTFRQPSQLPGYVFGGAPILKSQPSPGDVFVSRPLTDASLAYWQDDTSFIADRMFLPIPSQLSAGSLWEWDRTYFLRNEMDLRAPNAESAGAGLKLNNIPFGLNVYALHHDIEEQRTANELDPISSDDAAVLLLTQQAKQFREIQIAAAAFGTGIWTGMTDQVGVASAPGANQFLQFDAVGADPVHTVALWSSSVKTATGVRPNVLSIGRPVWDAIRTNAAILDRIKYGASSNGNPAIVNQAAVAQMMELDEILVSDVAKVTSNEGQATATFGFVIGKQAVLYYRPRVPAKNMPSAGYTVNWTGYMGATANGSRVKRFYLSHLSTWRVEIEQAFVQKITSSALGMFASAVVA